MSRIGQLTATIAVPRHGDLPLGTLDRISTAVTERVPAALTRRFPAPELPGVGSADRPVVLIRRLQVTAAVPATASADEIAERLADRMARAILTAPDDGQVRYPSRAGHIAAFVAALSRGTGDSWVFRSFDGARLLAPLTALRTLAERYAVPVVSVLGELHRTGDLAAVLTRASPAELNLTWAAALAVPHAALTAAEAVRHLESARVDDAEQPAFPSAEAVSMWLAARAVSLGQAPRLAVAIALALTGSVSRGDRGAAVREPVRDGPPESVESVPGRRTSDADVLEAAGAPAFLLLTSFEKVGLGQLSPARRAHVLAVATRTSPDDPAVQLASGLSGDSDADEPDAAGSENIAWVVQQALIDDDRLGRKRLDTFTAGGYLVVADAASGIWLAILEPAAAVDRALIPTLAGLPCGEAEPDEALTARIGADLRFLLPDDAENIDDTSRAVAVVVRAGLGHFARRLAGFGASSLPYLSDGFLTPGGVVADLGESLWVRLPAPPLQVVLALAGLDRTTFTVPWLRPAVTVTHVDTG